MLSVTLLGENCHILELYILELNRFLPAKAIQWNLPTWRSCSAFSPNRPGTAVIFWLLLGQRWHYLVQQHKERSTLLGLALTMPQKAFQPLLLAGWISDDGDDHYLPSRRFQPPAESPNNSAVIRLVPKSKMLSPSDASPLLRAEKTKLLPPLEPPPCTGREQRHEARLNSAQTRAFLGSAFLEKEKERVLGISTYSQVTRSTPE